MLAVTSDIASVLDGEDQVVAYRVRFELPGGLYPNLRLKLTQLHLESQTTTDAPDGSRLEEGYPAASGSFTVTGPISTDPTQLDDESKNAEWLFARYPVKADDGSVSPLYHQDVFGVLVHVDAGGKAPGATPNVGGADENGFEWFEKFTGEVEDYTRSAAGGVLFNLIERVRSDARSIPDLPAVVTAPPFNAGLTPEFAVDALLRAATGGEISSWPAQRPDCVLAVGMRTSLWAELGALGEPGLYQQPPSFAVGVHGSALVLGELNTGDPTYSITRYYTCSSALGDDVFVRCWLTGVPTGADTTADRFYLQLFNGDSPDSSAECVVNSSGVAVYLADGPGGIGTTISPFVWSTPVSAGAHYVSFHVHWPFGTSTASATVTVTLDGTSHTVSPTSSGSTRFAGDVWDACAFETDDGTRTLIEELQVTGETAPASDYGFIPLAVLDPSKNTLQVIPEISGDPYDTIQQIAAAELAVATGVPGGVFRFVNRDTLRAQPLAGTVSSRDALLAVDEQSAQTSVVNRAQVGYTSWDFAAARSAIWSADSVVKVAKLSTLPPIIVNLDDCAVDVDPASVLGDGVVDATISQYRVSVDAAGTAAHPGGVTVVARLATSKTLVVSIDNTSSIDGYFVSSSDFSDMTPGTVLLSIAARAVTPNAEQVSDFQWPPPDYVGANGRTGAAGTRFGEQPFTMTGNPWVQTQDAADLLAKAVVLDGHLPRVDLINTAIRPDPRLEPMDLVHIVDSDVTAVDDYARLFGYEIDFEAQDEGDDTYTMTVDARTIGPPGAWLLGIPGRSEIGSTTYVYAG